MRLRTSIVTLVMAAGMLAAGDADAAQTFVVNTADVDQNDANAGNGVCFSDFELGTGRELCPLRAAIHEANNNNNPTEVDRIRFKIPGKGPHTITLVSDMHEITEPVIIDGFSEPGSRKNQKTFGTDARYRIIVESGPGSLVAFRITTDDTIVRGLSIRNFFAGFIVAGGSNNRLEGSEVLGGANMVRIDNGSNNVIGGTKSIKRNRIADGGFPLIITGASASNNHIEGNLIGTTRSGKGDASNDYGVLLSDGTLNNTIGGTTKVAQNVFAFTEPNTAEGGLVLSNAGTGNRILRNSIHSNDGLGIDLGTEGPTPNDAGDGDTGPNNLQNKPTLDEARLRGDEIRIVGSLNSVQNATFTIRYYASPEADPSGFGEGKVFLGSETAQTPPAGNDDAWVHRVPAKSVKKGWVISATATRDLTADTSEFSANEAVF